MTFTKKWQAAAATALTLALIGGGATVATAAPGDEPVVLPGQPLNPQPAGSHAEGSKGGFFIFDADAIRADVDPNRVFAKDEYLFGAGDAVDYLATLNPAPHRPVSGELEFTGIYRFISETNTASVYGGTNTWLAYSVDSAAGPDGGTWTPPLTLEETGGSQDEIAKGGDYWYGIAYTYSNGVQVAGAIYRKINIQAGTGDYTFYPMELKAEDVYAGPDFANFAATAGAKAQIRNGNLTIDATAANAGKTVDVWAEGSAAKVATVTLDAAGTAVNTVPAGVANGTRLAIVENESALAWIVTGSFAWTQPDATANAATMKTLTDPAQGSALVTIDAGVANANKTFTAVGFSTPTELGNVTTNASGVATVDASALGNGAHTLALYDNTDTVVAWGTVTLTLDNRDADVALQVEALTSNKFALEGVAASANLGAAKRGATTTEVDLGAFTVIDDRDVDLLGWNLNADVTDFVNASANNDVIAKSALGIQPKSVGTLPQGISLAAAQVAGAGAYSALVAEGAAGSSTFEAGADLNAGLTFAVPAKAKKGTYTSTLTLTLVSK